MKKRLMALMLTAAMIVLPAMTAFAQEESLQGGKPVQEEVKYLDYVNGEMVEKSIGGDTGISYTLITEESSSVSRGWEAGWYVLDGPKAVDPIKTEGDVRIILKDNCEYWFEMTENSMEAIPGILVPADGTLTIYSQSIGDDMGELYAIGVNGGAGIGGPQGKNCGKITINGGYVTAEGNGGGAGIGGSIGKKGNDGLVGEPGQNASAGGNGGKGGDGEDGAEGGKGGSVSGITINAGIVEAVSYDGGAGIGGGRGGKGGDGGNGGLGGDASSPGNPGQGGAAGQGGKGGAGGDCTNIRINGGAVIASAYNEVCELTGLSAIGGGLGGEPGDDGIEGEPGGSLPTVSLAGLAGAGVGPAVGATGSASSLIFANGMHVTAGKQDEEVLITPVEGNDYAAKLVGQESVVAWYVGVQPEPEPEPEPEAEEPKPEKTGTADEPVSGGSWNMGPGGVWTYRTNGIFQETWGYIENPYAKSEADRYGWFWFDKNGEMATGWKQINGKWYYFNTDGTNGTRGMCLMNTTTPDGYKVGADGAWVQ